LFFNVPRATVRQSHNSLRRLNDREMLIQAARNILPIETGVRNNRPGSLSKRLDRTEGEISVAAGRVLLHNSTRSTNPLSYPTRLSPRTGQRFPNL